MTHALAAARAVTGALLQGLAIAVIGTGLLYLIAPLAPRAGPSISDALPLDELPGRAGAPLLLFALAWAAVAWSVTIVGLRTRTPLIAPIAFWISLVVLDTVSLRIVRQVQLISTLPAALTSTAPYLATAIVAAVDTIERRRVGPRNRSSGPGHR